MLSWWKHIMSWFKSKPVSKERFIDCCVSTPQFRGCKEKFHMHKQSGLFDTFELYFKSSKENKGDHDIQFHNIHDFYKAKISC